MVDAGQLRHRVEIQSLTESRNAHGGVTRTAATVAKRWARIEPLQGREFFDAQAVDATITHRVTLRYYSGLTPSHTIKYHDAGADTDRTLNIVSIQNTEELDAVQVCMCREDL